MKNSKDDTSSRPGYDSRLGFNDVLKLHMSSAALAASQDNYRIWLSSIKGMFRMISPYVSSTNKDIIKKKLLLADKYLNTSELKGFSRIKLEEAEEYIYLYGKHVFLPEVAGEEEEIDIEQWMRESDM